MCGRTVLLKPEHRQRTGSFKIRGAYHHIASLADDGGRIVAASAGNHAQGVALAATLLGRRSTIFMPAAAALPKVEATRRLRRRRRLVGRGGRRLPRPRPRRPPPTPAAHFVPPFDDPLVIAGQGTIGLEIAEEAPEAEVVVVPVGGGGLVSGVAAALAPRGAGDAGGRRAGRGGGGHGRLAGRRRGRSRSTGSTPSPTASPSSRRRALTLAHVRAYVDEVVTVSDEEIGRALILLLERAKAVVEPAGAVGLAALLGGQGRRHRPGGRRALGRQRRPADAHAS